GEPALRHVGGQQGHHRVPGARDSLAALELVELGAEERQRAIGSELDQDRAGLTRELSGALAVAPPRAHLGHGGELRGDPGLPADAPSQLERILVAALGRLGVAGGVIAERDVPKRVRLRERVRRPAERLLEVRPRRLVVVAYDLVDEADVEERLGDVVLVAGFATYCERALEVGHLLGRLAARAVA